MADGSCQDGNADSRMLSGQDRNTDNAANKAQSPELTE